jgi:tetratricopeptide (TPR) repeat protein
MQLHHSMRRVVAVLAAALCVTAVVFIARKPAPSDAGSRTAVGASAALSTSLDSLNAIIAAMRERTRRDPGDGEAAVLLADALVRKARVDSAPALALEAEQVIRATISHDPRDYAAERMLGVVLLSQHRFAEALDAARRAQRRRPDDAWNHAVAGDALLELGRYEEAFDAFDEVNRLRPDATAYARAAYARELQGDLEGAIRFMQMAAEGTGAHDPEGLAWYVCQIGNLRVLQGRLGDAEREYARADYMFPNHPYARSGRARVLIARSRFTEAARLLARGPETPEVWAMRGDIARHAGEPDAARAAYREAERLERQGWKEEEPQPGALARFLAERNLDPDAAVRLAQEAAAIRQDIQTLDALAWAQFRKGELGPAEAAIKGALRTGTLDPRIRCHASAIAAAREGGALPADVCDPLTLYGHPAESGDDGPQSARARTP